MAVRRSLVLLVLAALASVLLPASADQAATPEPQVVIAHIDAGINPYSPAFRDRSALAHVHPSKYIPGYPADVPALRLSLDAPDWETAFGRDKKIWDELLAQWNDGELAGQMFWVPGTRIVAAIRLSPGGTYCPPVAGVEPAPNLAAAATCTDYPILDDFGHGTMTASRMAGEGSSQCPTCRIVSIEGLGADASGWAAEQGWIDVQTNSWGSLAPEPVIAVADSSFATTLETAAQTHLVYFGSGNGAGFFLGAVPSPTQLAPTLVEGVVMVGAHDNGRVALWSGAPAHVVADGYGGLAAGNHDMKPVRPAPFACCTSASTPYAASQGAALVLEARRILGDRSTGVRDGIVASGAPLPPGRTGPLADGRLTLAELRAIVLHIATPRPTEGPHDGLTSWSGGPTAPNLLPYGAGENPYCPLCTTLPVQWTDVPADAPAYLSIGYGGTDAASLALGKKVLAGTATLPVRADVDELFAQESALRHLLHHPLP